MEISEKQLEANRRNAKLSTGPRSPEGKARAAMNGFKSPFTGLTAIMTEEDRLAHLDFINAYVKDLHPWGMAEYHLATSIAQDNWRINRMKAVEENIFAWGFEVNPGQRCSSDIPQVVNALSHANSYLTHADTIDKLSLYEARLSRVVARNMDRFTKLQAQRPARIEQSVSVPVTEEKTRAAGAANKANEPNEANKAAESNQPLTAENGFVPMVFEPSVQTLPEVGEAIKKAA